jgi:hypothetical protein
MMMNTKPRMLLTLPALVLTFCLFSPEQPTSAQSTSNCMKVKGTILDVGTSNTTTTITNGGILNGTGETVYGPDFVFTPDPTTVSFTADTTITTNRGILKTHNVYIVDFAIGLGTALYRIDPSTSTGIFAGATGVLYLNANATDFSAVVSAMTGEICFAP